MSNILTESALDPNNLANLLLGEKKGVIYQVFFMEIFGLDALY